MEQSVTIKYLKTCSLYIQTINIENAEFEQIQIGINSSNHELFLDTMCWGGGGGGVVATEEV